MSYVSPAIASITQNTLDVDFGFAAQTAGRVRGRIPEDLDFMRGFPDYAASNTIYPRSEWADRFEAMDKGKGWSQFYIVDSHDQDGEPSCVYNMLASITENIWNKKFGTHNHLFLSPISGYRWNGTRNSGSNIFGSASYSEGTGLLPVNNARNLSFVQRGLFKHTHPHNGYGANFQDGWKETAKCFRLLEWFRVTSLESWVSAHLDGFCLGGGRDGHAIFHASMAMDGNKLYSGYLNSWGLWGNTLEIANGLMLKSFGWDSEPKINSMINHGSYAGRTLRTPSWMDGGISL